MAASGDTVLMPLRRRLSGVAAGIAITGLVAVLIPIWAIHDLISRVRATRRTGSTQSIPRVSAGEVDLRTVMGDNRPVIISGLIDALDLQLTPDVQGLRRLAAHEPDAFRVQSFKRRAPYFLYVGDYGAELTTTSQMTLAQFLDFMFVDEPGPDTCTYRLFSVADLNGAIGTIIDDISNQLTPLVDRQPDRQASGIWIGSTGVVTPLHHDAWTGLLFQLSGTKRVLMFAPSDRPNLYFNSPFAATQRWSRLPGRSDEADLETFPRFRRTRRFEGRLEQGDVLFIPPFWSHEIEALEPNISIPFRFSSRPVDHLNPGFLRPSFEIFHRKFLKERVA